MKIAIYTEIEWAFGRITKNVQLHSKHEIDIYDWKKYNSEVNFTIYDLIYVTEWHIKDHFLKAFPYIHPNKIIAGIHNLTNLFSFDLKTEKQIDVNKEEINTNNYLDKDIVKWMIKKLPYAGCVSKELQLFIKKHNPEKLFPLITRCGISSNIIETSLKQFNYSRNQSSDILKIVYPYTKDFISGHKYNQKQSYYISQIESILKRDYPNILFYYTPNRFTIDEMDQWYD